MSLVLDSALDYAARGFRVIPLNGKIPRIKRWQDRASSDPGKIQQWFDGHWPDANIGLATGHGDLVIDIDPRNGGSESFKRMVGKRKFPETMSAATGGGGLHYWLKIPTVIGCFTNLGGFAGVDVRGIGGQVVVEPSVHPETGRDYVWLRPPGTQIALCPEWLFRVILDARPIKPASTGLPIKTGTRTGDDGLLLVELIVAFPVEGFGQRNSQMVKCVASMAGRGYEDATIVRVVADWWEHFAGLGTVRTSPSHAPVEIGKTLAVIRSSPRFQLSFSGMDHRTECRSIELNRSQMAWIGTAERPGPDGTREHNTIGITPIKGRLSDRVCDSDQEMAFVEALVAHATHELSGKPADTFKATNDQIQNGMMDRRPGTVIRDAQLDRLKAKYVTRPDQPASIAELMIEVERGFRSRRGVPGKPSVYRLAGLRTVLEMGDVPDGR